ncbi:MAG TPA: cytidine deaminase [Acidobacteriota bacterium]
MTDKEAALLLQHARAVRRRAYAPYSKFRVGAALLASDGTIYTGANIENSSYGLTVCAERVALQTAVAAGRRRFRGLVVVANGPKLVGPCGACRQVLAEFAPDLEIVLARPRGPGKRRRLRDLLPEAFSGAFLRR